MRVLFLSRSLRASPSPHRGGVSAALGEDFSGRLARRGHGEGHQRSHPRQVSGRKHSVPHQPLRQLYCRRTHGMFLDMFSAN